jgi:hypothetical protein
LASQEDAQHFNGLPPHIISTLDNMAFGIAQKEELDSFEVKKKLVTNVNKLSLKEIEYLILQMDMLIEKSVHENETIDDNNVEKDFVSFLIRLYY